MSKPRHTEPRRTVRLTELETIAVLSSLRFAIRRNTQLTTPDWILCQRLYRKLAVDKQTPSPAK